jgi:small-conductance mechanosensitive channel
LPVDHFRLIAEPTNVVLATSVVQIAGPSRVTELIRGSIAAIVSKFRPEAVLRDMLTSPLVRRTGVMLATPLGFLPAIIGLAIGVLVSVVVRRVVVVRMTRIAARTATQVDDLLLGTIRTALPLWGALLGLYVGLGMSTMADNVRATTSHVVIVLIGVSISWTLARLAGFMVRSAGGANHVLPAARILRNLAQTCVFLIGVLITLATIGVSVAPLLTALGIGGLAVGLALQDTLANLFAGFHILVSRQVRPGDFVKLASGEEGYVEDVAWRYTTIRRLPNDLIIVPNAQLASAVTTNFSLPSSEQGVLVEVAVAYEEDLERVERVTLEVARAVLRTVTGGVEGFSPLVRFHTFGDSGIGFTVVLRGKHFTDQYLLKHEFVKRLHQRYTELGITIPYPQRTIHWQPQHAEV